MWDPEQHMVTVSPNVDFGKIMQPPLNPNQHLQNLRDAFVVHDSSNVGTELSVKPIQEIRVADRYMSKCNSDTEILQLWQLKMRWCPMALVQ